MQRGKVKWFNNTKGYGFISSDIHNEDLFVHYSSIQADGYKTLKAGQNVLFDIEQSNKGLHAKNITLDQAQTSSTNPAAQQKP